MSTQPSHKATTWQPSTTKEEDWIKIDLHIHTLDDPKGRGGLFRHQLLERARSLGFPVLAITLHDAVLSEGRCSLMRPMGILVIPAAEVRLLWRGCHRAECEPRKKWRGLKDFDDLRSCSAARELYFLQLRRIHSMFLAAQLDRDCSQK